MRQGDRIAACFYSKDLSVTDSSFVANYSDLYTFHDTISSNLINNSLYGNRVVKTFVFAYRSDPTKVDTDGDWADDSVDVNPLVYHYGTITLGGSKYRLSNPDSGYIHVKNVPNDTTAGYGGYQKWFGNATFSCNNVNLLIDQTGCGVIAANDVMLYLTNGVSQYQWDNYRSAVLTTASSFSAIHLPGIYPININSTSAISPLFVQKFFLERGYSVSIKSVSATNKENLLNEIRLSIKNNRPVIMMEDDPLVGMGVLNYNKCKLYLYNSVDNTFIEDNNDFTYHYVTVTGIHEDDFSGMVYLRVQSWGNEYYIEYNEFCNYNIAHQVCNGKLVFVN